MRLKNMYKWLLAFLPIGLFITISDDVGIGYDLPVNSIQPEYCQTDNRSFAAGEEVSYKLYYQLGFIWLAAGEVDFKVTENKETYSINAVGRTISAFEWFFAVNDQYETIIDKKTLLPLEFTRDIHEGKFKLYNRFEFDQKNKKVISYKGRDRDNTKIEYFNLSGCMHDMMSILYCMRNADFDNYEVNESFPVTIFLEEEYPLMVHLKKKNEIKKIGGLGNFRAHALSPEVIEGYAFNEGTEMTIWVTADENRVPLMIETPVSVGSVKAVLKEWRGLKHPFSSFIFE